MSDSEYPVDIILRLVPFEASAFEANFVMPRLITEPANHRLRFIRAFLLIVGVYLRSQASSSVQNFAHPRRETRRFERLFKESKRRRFRLGIDESRH